ncbi:hypothetical protein TcasGA2_TC034476 [Tribolium castaneum]|uniref:G-protein coupled receptors family 1 profile domain-containing protein n=1 Tax=Tribolium castaneum TaxID=7070 RepID=A0A139WC11_TRICA|nr:hypothetical protein TcasGA2_TC034476 [Tribolium castaneum]
MNPENDQFFTGNLTNSADDSILIWALTRQVIKVFISVAAITCNILIVYATVKRNELKFHHLLNWSVLDTVCCLISPYMPLLVKALGYEQVEYEGAICWVLQTQSALQLVVYTTVFLLTIDWTIANYFENYYASYQSNATIIKIIYYLFAISYLLSASLHCLSNWRTIHHFANLNILRFLALYLTLLHLINCVYRKTKFDFGLISPTIFMLCWLPYLIVHTFLSSNENWVVFAYFVAHCFAFSAPIANVLFLAKTENELNEKFHQLIKLVANCLAQSMENNYTNTTQHYSVFVKSCEIVTFVMALCGIVANCIIVTVLIKSKEAKNHYYTYLINWCVCNSIFLACFSFYLHDIFYSLHGCIITYLQDTFMLGNIIFVSVLTLDWYVTNYSTQNCAYKCRKVSLFVTLITWILLAVFAMNSVFLCVHKIHFPVVTLTLLLATFCFFILFVVVHVLRLVKKQTSSRVFIKSNLMLILASSYVLCWLPNWIGMPFELSFGSVWDGIFVLLVGVGCANSGLVLILLIRYDETFAKSFGRNVGHFDDLRENQSDSLI